MEDFTLGLFLFWVVFPFYCSLYCEFCQGNGINISHKKESKKEEKRIYPENVIKYLDSDNEELVFPQVENNDKLIEAKEFENSETISVEENVETNNLVETIMKYQETTLPELDTLTCKVLRQIASKLNIKIRRNGKVQPKHWLVKQIQQELDNDKTNHISEIIAACL